MSVRLTNPGELSKDAINAVIDERNRRNKARGALGQDIRPAGGGVGQNDDELPPDDGVAGVTALSANGGDLRTGHINFSGAGTASVSDSAGAGPPDREFEVTAKSILIVASLPATGDTAIIYKRSSDDTLWWDQDGAGTWIQIGIASLSISGADNQVVRMHGTNGIQPSGWLINDSDDMSVIGGSLQVADGANAIARIEPGIIQIENGAESDVAFEAGIQGEPHKMFDIDAAGNLRWSPDGSASAPVEGPFGLIEAGRIGIDGTGTADALSAGRSLRIYESDGSGHGVITHPASDLELYFTDDNGDVHQVTAPEPKTTANIASIVSPRDGRFVYDTDLEALKVFDSQRFRHASQVGWNPFAYPLNFVADAAFTTALNLAANGGTALIPVHVTGHMLLESVSVRNTDTATAREWGWDLYAQFLNNGNSGENTITRVAASNGTEAFTPAMGLASTRTLAASSAPVYLGPGVYWLAVQSRHATSTFGLGTATTSNAFILNTLQTKTTTNPNGSTLDAVAATWTKGVNIPAVRLNGRVFGQTSAF